MSEWTDYSAALSLAIQATGLTTEDARRMLHDCVARGDIASRAAIWRPPHDEDDLRAPSAIRNAVPGPELWRYGKPVDGRPDALQIPEQCYDPNEEGLLHIGVGGEGIGLQLKTDEITRQFPAKAEGRRGSGGRPSKFDWAEVMIEAALILYEEGTNTVTQPALVQRMMLQFRDDSEGTQMRKRVGLLYQRFLAADAKT